ncbi:MAG: DUF3862 domain-containing protein [Pseudomonadota bacterium]
MSKKLYGITLVGVLMAGTPLLAMAENVTKSEFLLLEMGMSYHQVVNTIGPPDQELSRTEMAGYTTVMYMWRGKGGFGANMNAMFQNGKLISKSQFGLR